MSQPGVNLNVRYIGSISCNVPRIWTCHEDREQPKAMQKQPSFLVCVCVCVYARVYILCQILKDMQAVPNTCTYT